MMPTKLTLEGTTATLIGNHQIMVVPIGGTEKINNNGIPLLPPFQQRTNTATSGPPKNIIQGNELTITTRNVIERQPMNNTSSNDSSITIVETSDSDMNGEITFSFSKMKELRFMPLKSTINLIFHGSYIYFDNS